MPAKSDIPNVNCLWGEVVGLTLAKLGVMHAVIAPGSRSAPLVWGITRRIGKWGIESHSILDERSAGFYALGLAKSLDLPVALVCTSGTAAANFFPAVIEASLSAVPLLVLTADRPPELRDCHAGQAIDQVKMYGSYVRWHHEVALPESRPEMLKYLRQTLVQAWERAMHPWPGPVHLNFPFREPLAPVAQEGFQAPKDAELKKLWAGWPAPSSHCRNGSRFQRDCHTDDPFMKRRGIIIAGPTGAGGWETPEKELEKVAKKLGWPVLADALNPLRQAEAKGVKLITHYDTILRDASAAQALKPEVVVQIGPLPTSKVLRQWLMTLEVPVVAYHEGPENVDPLHRNTEHRRGDVATQLRHIWEDYECPKPVKKFVDGWSKREQAAKAGLAQWMNQTEWLFEGKAAWTLSRVLPKGTPVLVASGMPVRDAEYFWEAGGGQEIYANRGANGIDGTLSTALGVAHASRKPAVLYTGDLALLHDQNGFLAAKELSEHASLTIVLINNDGSGIFEHLPIAKFDPPFEKYFATPQGVNFEKLADLHGVEYMCPKTWAEFEKALRPLPKRGLRLVEVRTDRKRDAAYRKKLFEEIAGKL